MTLRQSLSNQFCLRTFEFGCVYIKSPLVAEKSDVGYTLVYLHSNGT